MYPVDERHRWSYPSKETLSSFLSNKGLSREVLERCTVRKLILNENQSEEVVIEWHHDRMTEDKTSFPNSPLSLDVEQVRCMLLTVLKTRTSTGEDHATERQAAYPWRTRHSKMTHTLKKFMVRSAW